MKKLILIALAFVTGLLVPYAAGAFIAWEANPGAWEPAGRYVIAVFSISAGIAACVFVTQMERKEV